LKECGAPKFLLTGHHAEIAPLAARKLRRKRQSAIDQIC